MKYEVKVKTFMNTVKLCNIVQKIPGDVSAIHGNYRVNAKSLLGLLSLDVSDTITLESDHFPGIVIEKLEGMNK